MLNLMLRSVGKPPVTGAPSDPAVAAFRDRTAKRLKKALADVIKTAKARNPKTTAILESDVRNALGEAASGFVPKQPRCKSKSFDAGTCFFFPKGTFKKLLKLLTKPLEPLTADGKKRKRYRWKGTSKEVLQHFIEKLELATLRQHA